MDASTVIIQAIGIAAAALMISSFQCRTNRNLFALQFGAVTLFAIQFFFLGGITGTIVLIIGMLRNFLLLQFHRGWPQKKRYMWMVIAAYIISAFFTYENIMSIFPLIAMSVGTYFMWTDNRGIIRLANLFVACPSWLVYDIYIGSYGGIINEVFIMISILISIKRYGFKALMEEKE